MIFILAIFSTGNAFASSRPFTVFKFFSSLGFIFSHQALRFGKSHSRRKILFLFTILGTGFHAGVAAWATLLRDYSSCFFFFLRRKFVSLLSSFKRLLFY